MSFPQDNARLITPHSVRDVSPRMAATSDRGCQQGDQPPNLLGLFGTGSWSRTFRSITCDASESRKRTEPPPPAYQRHLKARNVDVMYKCRVFKEQVRRRNNSVSNSSRVQHYCTHSVLALRRVYVHGVFGRRPCAERGNVPTRQRWWPV